MTRRFTNIAGLFFFALSGTRFAFPQGTPSKGVAKSVRISGRAISPDGGGVSIGVQMVRIASDGVTVESPVETVKAGPNGVFTFFGAPSTQYRISRECVVTPTKDVFTGSGKNNVNVGNMVVNNRVPMAITVSVPPSSDLVADLTPEQIVTEPQKAVDRGSASFPHFSPVPTPPSSKAATLTQCLFAPSLDRRAEWKSFPIVSFNRPLSIELFVGGSVKLIRVVHYDPRLSPSQIREEVRRVWLSKFRDATTIITWSEGSPWNIEGSIEYEDGKQSSILMDGRIHVRVQDREGTYWFIRM